MTTPQLTTTDFTKSDIDAFHDLMTDLLATCRTVASKHAPAGTWTPSTSHLFDQFGESMAVIAEISRALNSTRGGIRRIDARARQRLYDRAVRLPASP
jgi:hypothetical protein